MRTQVSNAWLWVPWSLAQVLSLTPCSLLLPCSVASLNSYQVPGDWSSLHTLSSPHIPQKQGVVPRASAQLWRVFGNNGRKIVHQMDLKQGFSESTMGGIGKSSAVLYLDSQPIQWPPWHGRRTAALVVKNRASPTSWPSCPERRWRTGLTCEHRLSAQEKKSSGVPAWLDFKMEKRPGVKT